ncbi:succinyl-CoA synthetase, beta subunit [Hydrogenobacter thermophilus TK-6]|uniref:Succinate--CoA ligase [ADP-forming] subunit beta n=2 Tax=Hydrogenobacter thermophilus TaxID=940 RepID=D3DKI5_HYDTT|nr:ADP-forming succinate--CoA ligase subunit beta [Hydrogenobacter thermophilus]ADO46255.1 succinyl-CoA synthetase, beta subunit [Hydrogenobacter thermophilus TK-6]BAD17851.1 succinyl-CoA synthetase large subunit [Hydrogenobacter thermophilus TK-6]BAI70337.1 succinyl-CoA synthetase beta subunit [Hydrogenobacter thermophilus TK-6]
MKLHEHQAKEILKRYNLPVPEGKVAFSLQEALQVAEELSGYPLVVKAQVHCGGRGKAGGVKLVKNQEELREAVESMLGKVLKTFQCPEGKPVSRVWIEKATNIEKEFYLSITLDRSVSKPVFMASAEGGMEIEEVAKEKPEAIHTLHIDPALGLMPFQARKIAFKLGLPVNEFVRISLALYKMYTDMDASLVEINPLVLTKEGNLILLDAKVEIDDNAMLRHKDVEELEDLTQLDPLEIEAKRYSLNYIKLDGNIGCMVNGAGLAMTTMDIIKLAGGDPANFLDVGGGANVEQIANAFRILMADKNVKAVFINIFGGILRCDRLAQGLIEAAKMVEIKVPVVVRMEGTNVEEGRRLLSESGLNFVNAVDMWDGAKKATELALR